MQLDKIYLIGSMGCGKSTLGLKLAKILDFKFIDLDKEIEEYEKLSIPQIFELKGEQYFRHIEHHLLLNLKSLSKVVVAVGGGTPCFYNNIEVMKQNGIVFFINVSPNQLTKRLKLQAANRPMLYGLNQTQIFAKISALLKERITYYEKANFTFVNDNLTAEEIATFYYQLKREVDKNISY